jgi:MFS family permease
MDDGGKVPETLTRSRELPWFGLLKVRRFRWLWAGVGLSMLADQAFLVALTWLVLRVAGAGVELGAVLAVASIPGIVLMPVGGVIGDRFPPSLVLVVSSVVRALLLAVLAMLAVLDATDLWHVYALAGGLSAMDALYYPASMAAIPATVERDRLETANASIQGAEQVSGIVGPTTAAFAVAFVGLGSGLAMISLMFVAAAAVFAFMARATGVRTLAGATGRSTRISESTPEGEEHAGSQSVLADLLVGLRYAWRDPIIRTILLVLVGINAAMMGPLYVGGATLAQRELGGVGAFGVLVAAASAGALLGSLIAGSIMRVRRRGLVVLVLTASLGLEVAAFCLITNLAVAIILALAIGASASFLAVINISWLQERAEPGLTGRVMSLAVLATMALDPISFALAGVLVEVNLKATFVGAGALLLLTAMLGATNRATRVAD